MTPSHLSDERLTDAYFAARGEPGRERPIADHLAECPHCARRFDALARMLDQARADADADIERTYPPDRLQRQRRSIERRLALVGRQARVLPFPSAAEHLPPLVTLARRPKALPRWMAVAAVAGLAAGAGMNVFIGHADRRATGTRGLHVARSLPLATSQPLVRSAHPDDAFMSELESAAKGPRTPELEALDALTPHLIEIAAVTGVR